MALRTISWSKGIAQNEIWLQLHALTCNFGVFVQANDLPQEMADWSLTSLQTGLVRTGAQAVRHARAVTFQSAEVAVSGYMVTRILAALRRLCAPLAPA